MRSRLQQLLFGQGIDMPATLGQQSSFPAVERNQRLTQPLDIHHLARSEMQNALLEPCRAVRIDAAIIRLSFIPAPPHCRTLGRQQEKTKNFPPRGCCASSTTATIFGITSPPRSTVHPVSDLDPQPLDLVGVVQCRAAYRCTPNQTPDEARATGVNLPVRPTCTVMSSIWVTPERAVNL